MKIDPYIVNQIAHSLFGDRYIIIYDDTIQFHNHCYHVRTIDAKEHAYKGYYYLQDANSNLAMWDDEVCAPPGYYGTIFDPKTGNIVRREPINGE